jgi:Cu(I)/Ag(I) efflux system membrane fusion protein
MKPILRTLLPLTLLLLTTALPAAAQGTAFQEILTHYENARQTLATDTDEGVAEKGRAIHGILESLAADWSAERAGVDPTEAEAARALLPELTEAAAALAESSDIQTARDAFYELSKPLVRLRGAVRGDVPVVAYCSMAKRSWLQPEGELGNPYYGRSMPTCGEVVDG